MHAHLSEKGGFYPVPLEKFVSLASDLPSPEELAMRKELYENLSEEAGFLLDFILSSDGSEKLWWGSDKNKRIKRGLLHTFLRQRFGWTEFTAHEAWRELRQYLREATALAS